MMKLIMKYSALGMPVVVSGLRVHCKMEFAAKHLPWTMSQVSRVRQALSRDDTPEVKLIRQQAWISFLKLQAHIGANTIDPNSNRAENHEAMLEQLKLQREYMEHVQSYRLKGGKDSINIEYLFTSQFDARYEILLTHLKLQQSTGGWWLTSVPPGQTRLLWSHAALRHQMSPTYTGVSSFDLI